MRDTFFDLISSVTEQELQWVGKKDAVENMPEYAMYVEAVRRIQAWTFRRMAATMPEGDPMHRMFIELAEGVERVPDIDLWIGESGASGS